MDQQPIVRPGQPARNLSLKDQDNTTWDLYEQQDRRVLLSFHPLAWTDYCAAQMQSLEEHRKTFKELNTVAVGISVDSIPCKRAWAKQLGIEGTRLLCDFWPHGKVAAAFGIFREENGFSERANILLDEHRDVAWVKVYPVHSVPDIQEVIGVLKKR
ncbi:MAG: redoxin domain-containing protein [Methanomicrobiales archaeon]|jgi:peroxiredoxin|nr:redoxin domain-containing protein [Methanomicrobiales archaeon]MDD1644996.1 redoxin domain-containing protein [Methanomicrobiales archaeon]MDD1648654.1 redoxin domain-containing protein [Methanomicrobiales archaeon]